MRAAPPEPLTDDEVGLLDRYWRAANYLSVGQIYLLDDPLLEVPLAPQHIKPRLLGHWGTTSGQNFLYTHLNRAIVRRDLTAIYVCGPGHGGPAVVANTYLEGTYSELYPHIGRSTEGLRRLFRQFSFPGGIPSHAAPETPGSINEGGELGYSLMHATGAVFDDPDLIAFCVIGDGEAETGPLATSWHAPAFLDAARDGAVVPILHLNGWKIANPTVLARLPEEQLLQLIRGWGWEPVVVAGDDPATMHRDLAAALDRVLDRVGEIQEQARARGSRDADPPPRAALDGAVPPDARPTPPRWPMIVFRSPKGWTGPREVDGQQVEGTFRAHQVPLPAVRTDPAHLRQLEDWLRSYRPEELFDADGALLPELQALAPTGDARMGSNPRTNGGLLLQDLELPDFRSYGVPVDAPGTAAHSATAVLGGWLADVVRDNPTRFRLFGPDETASNRLDAVFEATDRAWQQPVVGTDDHLAPDGRVMEVLSEHLLQGWLEGYLLTGRHGLLNSYEAFAHIVDSMVNQHAKWLHDINRIPWRRDIASLNYLISSHVWRQDHNGSSHQDPGFMDHVVNKKAEIARVYLPPDTNCLLSIADHVLRSRQCINVVVAGKEAQLDYLTMDEAIAHCARGAGIWSWASTTDGEPDVVLACAGEVPTMEALAAADLLRQHLPDLAVRVVNVVDLMRLQSPDEHPHGLDDTDFDALFTADKPVVFAFHGYPALVHRLTYKRANHAQFHVHGYLEEGTTTTPFDMVAMNRLDRFTLAMDVIDRVPSLGSAQAVLRQRFADARLAARAYTREHGEDDPAIAGWTWPHR